MHSEQEQASTRSFVLGVSGAVTTPTTANSTSSPDWRRKMTATTSEASVRVSSGADRHVFSHYASSYSTQFRPQTVGGVLAGKQETGFARNSQGYVEGRRYEAEPLQLSSVQQRKALVSKRLEYEGNVHSSMYKSFHGASAVQPREMRFPTTAARASTGFASNNKWLSLSDAAVTVSPVTNSVVLSKLRQTAPVEAENHGTGPALMSTTYKAHYSEKDPSSSIVPGEPQPTVMIGRKEETGFTLGNQAYVQRPTTPQDRMPVARYPHLAPQASPHKRELDAYVTKRSIAATSYLPTRGLTGAEDSFPTVATEDSGFSRSITQLQFTSGVQPVKHSELHPKVLHRIQRSDPQEFHTMEQPARMISTTHSMHAQPRARTAPSDAAREVHPNAVKISGFASNERGYVPQQTLSTDHAWLASARTMRQKRAAAIDAHVGTTMSATSWQHPAVHKRDLWPTHPTNSSGFALAVVNHVSPDKPRPLVPPAVDPQLHPTVQRMLAIKDPVNYRKGAANDAAYPHKHRTDGHL
eukprot:TRINITY_DN8996_c0_g1_i1.p1 TRINITY_DN8996_c0_g1~~TRINITY_DN8996_c0_g1_i1.p1  ORF type:complete len:525 (+),score=88.76 TRINITY_DN8996_c0_g1_i1:1053-2627(+)